jgi:DNA-binding MurR/RpiR family transcriptional regulator
MNSLKQHIRVQYSSLTEAQKKVAEHLLKEPSASAVDSAAEIGKKSGVSEATVIRFCYAIGYNGFTEVQKELQRELLSHKSSLDDYVESKREIGHGSHFYAQIMEKDRENIASLIQTLETHVLDSVIDSLLLSKNILVVGTLGSYAAAHWFGHMLNLLRGSTSVYKGETENTFSLIDMDENWTLIVLSFQRYSKESLRVTQIGKERGAKIIAITDSLLAPMSAHADLVIPLEIEQTSTIDNATPLLSLLNSLLAAYSIKDLDGVKKRMEQYDATAEAMDLYSSKG